ncbi:hypothetical protein AB0K15_12240 [Amycolatopsis sp. NPDC049253]|uniref:hypothetical protein n=1 Tax=Amycolatopsis sp. NPDC049253 TaxID=3155274 RepID=UPI003415147D
MQLRVDQRQRGRGRAADMETAEEEFQDLVLDDLDDWKRQRERSGGTVPDVGQTDAALNLDSWFPRGWGEWVEAGMSAEGWRDAQ